MSSSASARFARSSADRARAGTARSERSPVRPRASSATCTVSRTVSSGKSVAAWNVRPRPRRARAVPATRSTRRGRAGRTRPVACTYPPIAFISVDLPAPLVPISPTISSGADADRHVVDGGDAAEAHRHVGRRSAGTPIGERRRAGRRRSTDGGVPIGVAGRRDSRSTHVEQRVACRVADLREPAREVQQEDSSPTLDVSSGTSSLSGKNAGRPTTHSAPSTGPTTEPSPPITTIDTRMQRVLDEEEPLGEGDRLRRARRAARRRTRRCRPASANARSFTRAGSTV